MTSLELVAFGSLWVIACLLGGLVLLLYRQVDKAYRLQASEAGGLLPGVDAPPLEILTDEGTVPLMLPSNGGLVVLAFMSTSCDACSKLMPLLANDAILLLPVYALMSGETTNTTVRSDNPRVETWWLAHPPDAVRRYGASVSPFLYVLRDRTVLASRVVATRSALDRLLEEATENEERLKPRDPATAEVAEVV